ncbi:protein kintoun [Denticeps clupeoides]|uniref:protein kintoun n=1 Tax=Denticeps clupeoides TaxID=299321 RepID=UPI0010A4F655|nr:protein kintoun [Denticeps clupeoides]
MEFESKLEEMNLSKDEISRLCSAMKDDTFRGLLRDYTEEISNPENRKKYEEEIKMLEQERGVGVQFIHPTPYRVIKSSLDGKRKCFINICSNELIKAPECKVGQNENGKVGHHWSLPYSLTPGRPDVDSKGNQCMIYDVVFHPDTLQMASKNGLFMRLVDSTAVEGVQDAFKVQVDIKNAKVLKSKYKGVPQASVIRKSILGQTPKEQSPDLDDRLSFPYPYKPKLEKSAGSQNITESSHPSQNRKCDATKQPTRPHYTVKYRSLIDLQDYRCSRDSGPGPRPRDIIITIELPLLRSAADAHLDVTEKRLLLISHKPAYKLDLTLTYPVDESKGEAKFNKAKKQLTITLPILPPKEGLAVECFMPMARTESEEENQNQTDGEGQIEVIQEHSIESNCDPTGLHTDFQEQMASDIEKSNTMRDIWDNEDCSNFKEQLSLPPDSSECSTDISNEQTMDISDKVSLVASSSALTNEIKYTTKTEMSSITPPYETKDGLCNFIAVEDCSEAKCSLEMKDRNSSQSSEQSTHAIKKLPESVNTSGCCDQSAAHELAHGARNGEDDNILTTKEHGLEKAAQKNCRTSLPAVLREKRPDGCEVVISDHKTSANFLFNNSLIFELE